ncbi:uncharacterized protein BYT42DRAFT_216757 [Radiomyces spectabilis]|uniref:uncharacterized protein n=1 Tax=Radiomyces spectabilis TaxID=64574 RepID=UPI00221FAB62|nr:uncharacterized protein BYT42DRAFT_216757 [Radiomyces spectabilis]KAI8387988.1 hypothetical protein BYT42DRAFT_216757 [Radiomyces spectabilis]
MQIPRQIWIYGAVTCVAVAGITYYIIQEDRQVKRRKQLKAAHRQALQLLQEIENDRQAIESDVGQMEKTIASAPSNDVDEDRAVAEKEHKRREFVLAQCNELLLRLLERLDAIQPRSVIVGHTDSLQLTSFEDSLIQDIKSKKKRIIQKVEKNFRNIDHCKEQLKQQPQS